MSSTALAQLPALSATPTDESSATAENARLLADILRDQQAREALIQELVRIAEGAKGSEQAETATAPVESSSFARTVAEYSVEFAQSSLQRLEGVRDWALQFYGALFAKDGRTLRGLGDAALSLVLVIGSTMAVFLGLALLAQAIYRWFAARSEGAGWVRRAASILFSVVVDAVVVLLAWACGYALAIFAIGETGSLDVVESLYLNAFLIVESVRVLMRGALAPRYGSLRVLSMSDTSAAYWYFWASRLVALLGYGFLLAMPIVRATFPPGVAEGVGLLIGFSALILVILLVLQNRQSVRERLERRGSEDTSEYLVSAQNGLARSWHVLAILYFIGLFMVWSTRPEGALTLMLRASGESLLMITLGVLLMTLISRFVTGGMRLPADVKARLPLLELRLNAFVPTVLKVVRPIILVVVVMLVANAWGLFDFFGWIASEGGRELVSRVFGVAFVTVLAFFLWLAISSWVEYRLNPNYGRPPTARERTLLALLRNAATIAIVAVAAMIVLSEIGVNIGPLLAGAGVLGLAVGFGAQKLVQDIITGIFIQFENAINEGDVITVAGLTGAVDRLTIRSVSLRDLNGTYHIVPFSSVDSVSNFMRGFAYHVAEVGFAYREDTEQTKAVMHRAFDELNSNEDYARYIIGPLEWHGVTQLGDSAVVQRARIKTIPGQQWGVGRAYSEIVKRLCDEAGIEIPYPHTTVYFGEDKCGEAPPLRVRLPQDFTAKTTSNGANMSAPSPD
jgi:small conductance mechanosensitive channel